MSGDPVVGAGFNTVPAGSDATGFGAGEAATLSADVAENARLQHVEFACPFEVPTSHDESNDIGTVSEVALHR